MVEAVTGEPPVRVTDIAMVADVRLYIQGLDELPDTPITEGGPSVKDILRNNYGDSFEAYGLRRYVGDIVRGRYIELKSGPLAKMRAWDLVDDGWFDWGIASAIALPPTRTESGKIKNDFNVNMFDFIFF